MADPDRLRLQQALVGAGVLLLAAGLAWGASGIPSTAGYQGVGPNFLPWVVTVVLALCGALLLWQALNGGYREMEAPSGAERGDWPAIAWVAAGVVANASLITTLGFVASCTLCFVMAVRGLRLSEGRAGGGLVRTMQDVATGALIAAPAFWLFTKLLSINLPGLTGTGWL